MPPKQKTTAQTTDSAGRDPGQIRLSRKVLRAYDLNVLDVKPVRGVFRIETPRGPRCLKKVDYGVGDLLFINSAMEHLVGNGFPRVARFHPNRDGQPFTAVGNRLFVLADWIDGRECDYDLPADLDLASRTLAELHLASRGFTPPPEARNRAEWGRWPEKFWSRCVDLQAMKMTISRRRRKTRFDREFERWIDYHYRHGLKSLEILERSPYAKVTERGKAEKSFCHHDYAHHNVILNEAGLAHLIDFDYCIADIRSHDLASLIQRNMKGYGWDFNVARFILDSYSSVSPVSPDELIVMLAFFWFPQDFWQVGLQFYVEKKDWGDRFLDILRRKTKYLAYREVFLHQFAEYTAEKAGASLSDLGAPEVLREEAIYFLV